MSQQSDPIQALKAAGIDVDQIPESQRKVLGELSPEEVNTLIKVQKRMSSETEVEGYLAGDRGNVFW